MTTERQLLKEAAETIKHLQYLFSITDQDGTERDNPKYWKCTEVQAKIETHLSQPDAVAMTWPQALDKGCMDFFVLSFDQALEYIAMRSLKPYEEKIKLLNLALSEAAHLFMESNRVQRWIPITGQKLLHDTPYAFMDNDGDMIIGKLSESEGRVWLNESFGGDITHVWSLSDFTHYAMLPGMLGVYLEGNK